MENKTKQFNWDRMFGAIAYIIGIGAISLNRTLPTISTSINNTILLQNSIVNITANVSDDVGLSFLPIYNKPNRNM